MVEWFKDFYNSIRQSALAELFSYLTKVVGIFRHRRIEIPRRSIRKGSGISIQSDCASHLSACGHAQAGADRWSVMDVHYKNIGASFTCFTGG